MQPTSNSFANTFYLIIALLPLAPVLLVFLQKKYDATPMNFLVIVCLLGLVKGLPDRFPLLNTDNQYITRNIISLLELVAYIQLFKTVMSPTWRAGLNIFLVAFLSSLLTYFFLKGWERRSPGLDILESGVMVGVIIVSLLSLVRSRILQIFQSPLFWIAGGSLFYFMLFMLVEGSGPCCMPAGMTPNAEYSILLSIAGLIRYGFYIGAVLVCPRNVTP